MMAQDYKKLRDKWYKKLKASGFEDIEDVNCPNEKLRQWHSSYIRTHYSVNVIKERQEYYSAAAWFLHNYAFESDGEKQIWELHSNGFSLREIAYEIGTNKDSVHKIVSKLIKIMKWGF